MSIRARRHTVPLLAALALAAVPAGAHATTLYVTRDTFPATVHRLTVAADGSIADPSPATQLPFDEAMRAAIAPDGSHLYFTSDTTAAQLAQFSLSADGALAPLAPPMLPTVAESVPIVVSPDGGSVYLAGGTSTYAVDQFSVGAGGALNPKSPASVPTVGANDLVMTPDGRHLYVSDFGTPGTISQYAVGSDGTLTPLATPHVTTPGQFPVGMAVTPDGKSLYVGIDGTSEGGTSVAQYDIGADGALTPKSPASIPLPTGAQPVSLATSPDGSDLYVADEQPGGGVDAYAIGSGGALTSLGPAAGTAAIVTVLPSADGRSLYAGTTDGRVIRFAVEADGTLSTTSSAVTIGQQPLGLAITPDQGPLASFTATAAAAGTPTTFDASASTDPDGSVARYDWSFGDGTTASRTTPTTAHAYAAAGTFTVTLTVTDNDGASTERVFTGHQVLRNGSAAAAASQPVVVPAAPAGGGEPSTSTAAAGTTVTTIRIPRLTKLKIAPARFRVGAASRRAGIATASRKKQSAARPKAGATVSFHLDMRGNVRVTVAQQRSGRRATKQAACKLGARRGTRCTTWVALKGSDKLARPAGVSKLTFSGRFAHHALKPGRYRLTLTPFTGRHAGKPVSALFTIVH